MLPISRIRQGHAINIAGRVAFISDRWPEDRESGRTEIIYEDDGTKSRFVWDTMNPFVEDLGEAELIVKIFLK